MSINEDLNERLSDIEKKLNELFTQVQEFRTILNENRESIIENGEKKNLAPALQDTYDILKEKSPCTALEVSLITGRSRPNESARLLELVDLGYADRITRGRRVIFHIKKN